MKPASSCSPFALLSTTLVLEHQLSLPLSGQLPAPVLYSHGGVCLPSASVWKPSSQAVYAGVHPVCCPAEAGRNSDRKSPAFGATA